jgi:hypothetical protein
MLHAMHRIAAVLAGDGTITGLYQFKNAVRDTAEKNSVIPLMMLIHSWRLRPLISKTMPLDPSAPTDIGYDIEDESEIKGQAKVHAHRIGIPPNTPYYRVLLDALRYQAVLDSPRAGFNIDFFKDKLINACKSAKGVDDPMSVQPSPERKGVTTARTHPTQDSQEKPPNEHQREWTEWGKRNPDGCNPWQ